MQYNQIYCHFLKQNLRAYIMKFIINTKTCRESSLSNFQLRLCFTEEELQIWQLDLLTGSLRNLRCLSESTSMTTKWHQVSPKWSQMIPKWSQIILRWSQMTHKVFQMTQWSQLIPSRSCRPLVLFLINNLLFHFIPKNEGKVKQIH